MRNTWLYAIPMLLLAGTASAQTVTYTGPVTVTATKNPMSAFEFPGSVTVVDQAEIEDKMPSSADDILNDVPNVTFAGGPRRTGEVPIIRGFSGNDVIVLLDGTRQNYISGHDGRFYLDPALLNQVEVVRGAQSALYGSGGLGGVIEFRTKDASDFLAPGQTAGFNIFTGYQSANDEWAPGITLFATPMAGLDLIGSFVYRNSGDIDLGGGPDLEADDEILSGLFKASYTLDASRVEFGWTRYDGSAIEPNNAQGLGGADYVDKDLMAETWSAAYSYHEIGNDWVDLNAKVYYTRYKADEQRLDDLGEGNAGELLTRDLDTIGFTLDNRTRFALGETSNVVLTYGGEFYRDKQEGTSDAGERVGVPNAESRYFGAFLQAEFNFEAPLGLPGEFLVIPGLRYDNFRSESELAADNQDDQVSPKIAVSYLPTEWLMFYGSYGHAFSAPNLNDLYATGVHFTIPTGSPNSPAINSFQPNPDLTPQKTKTFEFGMGVDFEEILWLDDRLWAKGGYFRTKADDLISRDVVQPVVGGCFGPFGNARLCDGTTTFANINKAELHGIEVEAGYENEYFLVEIAYGHIDGENTETGEPIGDLQPDQVTFHLAGKLPRLDSVVGWRVTAADDFTGAEPEEDRDGYIVNDLYAMWRPQQEILKGLTIGVGVDNVLDEEYSRVFTGANEVGRNYKAWVSYTLAW